MKLKTYILFVTCLFLCSCHKSSGVYTDEMDRDYRLYDYYEDAYGNAGVVASIVSNKNENGIIVISLDEANLPWGPMGEIVYNDSITGSGSLEVYFGVAMLQIMKAVGIDHYPAQAWCDAKNGDETYVRGGSWRLPTYHELRLTFGDEGSCVPALNQALLKAGGTPISTDVFDMYWTCVEDKPKFVKFSDVENTYDPANRAIPVNYQYRFYTDRDQWIKKNRYNVRAIKYIYYQNVRK